MEYLDDDVVHMALRARVMPIVVATTGATALAATTTGFTRTTGSFIDDKFRRGMEIVSSGFGPAADNVKSVITSVSPTDLRASPFVVTVSGGTQTVTRPALVADPSAAGRTLIATLPSMRAWENEAPTGLTTFIPAAGIPYIEEEYSPGPTEVITQTIRESTGDYIIKIHGILGSGASGMRIIGNAVKAVFPVGLIIIAGEYKIRTRFDFAAEAGSIVQTTAGPVLILTIPWMVRWRATPVTV